MGDKSQSIKFVQLDSKIFDICAEKLGEGLSVIIDILNPEAIILGSIYQRCENLLKKRMWEVIERESLYYSHSICKILPAKLKDKIASMEELGLTVIAVNPENNDLLKEAVELIGKATGQTAKADDLVKTIDKGISSLKDRVGSETNPTVYIAGNSNILQTAGAKMYQNTLIENAGGVNVAAEIDDNYWAEVSYEQILKWDPDYIILAADADYTVDDVLKDTNLADCKAVKNGNVYIVPSDAEALDSPVPAGYLGSYYIASVIHSDIVSEEDFQTEAINFYEKFYEFTPYKN